MFQRCITSPFGHNPDFFVSSALLLEFDSIFIVSWNGSLRILSFIKGGDLRNALAEHSFNEDFQPDLELGWSRWRGCYVAFPHLITSWKYDYFINETVT